MYPIPFPRGLCLSVWAGVISNYQLDYYSPAQRSQVPALVNEAPGAGGGHQTQSLVTNYLQTTSLFVYVGAWIPCLMFEFDMF